MNDLWIFRCPNANVSLGPGQQMEPRGLKVNCWVARLTSPCERNGKLHGHEKNNKYQTMFPTHVLEIECVQCSKVSWKVSHGVFIEHLCFNHEINKHIQRAETLEKTWHGSTYLLQKPVYSNQTIHFHHTIFFCVSPKKVIC